MGDSRKGMYNKKSDFRPMHVLTGSASTAQAQQAGGTHYEMLQDVPTHYSLFRPEIIENTNPLRAGALLGEKELHVARSYGRLQGHPESKIPEGYRRPFNQVSFLGSAQNHGNEHSTSFPACRIANNGSLAAEEQTMGGFIEQVDSNSRIPLSKESRNQLTSASLSVISRRNSSGDLYNTKYHGKGSEVPDSVHLAGLIGPALESDIEAYTHSRFHSARNKQNFSNSSAYHLSGTSLGARLNLVASLERESSYKDHSFWTEGDAQHIPGASSSLRGPSKRKLSELSAAFSGSPSVSSCGSDFSGRSRSAISRSSAIGRLHARHFNSNSVVINSESFACQHMAPVVAQPEVLMADSFEESYCSQRRGFLGELSNRDPETLQSIHPFQIPLSADAAMRSGSDNRGSSPASVVIGRSFPNQRPDYMRAAQAENAAQVDLWPARVVQSVGSIFDQNIVGAQSAHLYPVTHFSRLHGVLSSPIMTRGGENSFLPHMEVPGDRFAENHSTSRIAQLSATNETPFEGFTDGSFESQTMSCYGADSRNWINSSHPMPAVNLSSTCSSSDHRNRRVRPSPQWTGNRQLHCLTTPPAYSLPGLRPTALVPLSLDNYSSTGLVKHPTSMHTFQGHLIASSIEDHNVHIPSATSGMPVELPPHRMYRFHATDDRRHNTPGGVAQIVTVTDQRVRDEEVRSYEQLLMLEATAIYGGLQDQYSDWRLDIDNMSYEDLLALEERMGNVCTGVAEDVISKKLVTRKFVSLDAATSSSSQDTEVKCSVCQEDYEEGDDLGRLECGHNYHVICIKQWLIQKNLCPVCKSSAFS